MPAAHDIYTEQLAGLRRGSPLYHPEPRPEGPVNIGDVGYIRHGAFRRLFNVSQPANHPVQRFGVPVGFVQLDIGHIDIFDAALEPGPLHSKTVSTTFTEIGTPSEILPAQASFHFSCSSKRGAILMLETQMIHEEAIQEQRFENYLIQHCASWHAFARSLDLHIGFGDLILVTECSKTAAWSSAVYSNNATEFGLSFSVGTPFTTAGISASKSLEKIGPVERRRSQQRAQAHGPPLPKNHTVFIKGYRLGMRQMYYQSLVSLFTKARRRSPTPSDREGVDGASSRPSSPAARSPSSPSPSGSFVMGPYEPDFHASIALLALEMERNNDPECVVLHDDIWCSAAPDSEESRIMKEYTDFYFSDETNNYLNSMYGGIVYDDTGLQQFAIDEGSPSQQRSDTSQNGNLDEYLISSGQILDPIPIPTNSSIAESLLDFNLFTSSPSWESGTSSSRGVYRTEHRNLEFTDGLPTSMSVEKQDIMGRQSNQDSGGDDLEGAIDFRTVHDTPGDETDATMQGFVAMADEERHVRSSFLSECLMPCEPYDYRWFRARTPETPLWAQIVLSTPRENDNRGPNSPENCVAANPMSPQRAEIDSGLAQDISGSRTGVTMWSLAAMADEERLVRGSFGSGFSSVHYSPYGEGSLARRSHVRTLETPLWTQNAIRAAQQEADTPHENNDRDPNSAATDPMSPQPAEIDSPAHDVPRDPMMQSFVATADEERQFMASLRRHVE